MSVHIVRWVVLFASICLLVVTPAAAQSTPSIPTLPGKLEWLNAPRSSRMDGKVFVISSGAKTDWFVDPFDGTVSKNAPILLFTPGSDYVLTARVTVKFATKWDAGALMLWGDDHHWAKLSFELSPDRQPTLVTVVTRGLSDDCNSARMQRDSVYLRIARSDKTYVFYSSVDASHWEILRTFSLDTDLPIRAGFESQSPAGEGAIASFSSITYTPRRIENIYK